MIVTSGSESFRLPPMWAVLRHARFTLVWLGELLSITGDVAYAVAFAWLVLSVTGSPALLAGILVAGSIPRGVLLLIGGAVTDRFRARTVMFCAHTARDDSPVSIRVLAREIRAGLSYARRSVTVRVILALVSAATLSYAGLFGIGLPALASTLPHGAVALGAIVSAWGLGQFLGALSAGITGLPTRWGMLIIGMACCDAVGFALVGFVPNLVLVVILLALLGFGTSYSSDVALPTWLQTNTPTEFLGRVNSIVDLPRVALEPVSLAVMGLLATHGPRWIFLFAALPLLSVAILLLANRTARTLRVAPHIESLP